MVPPHTPLFLPPAASWDLSAVLDSHATRGFHGWEQDALAEFSCDGYCINDQKSAWLLHIPVLHLCSLRLPLGKHSRCAHFIEFIPIRYLPIGKNIIILIALSAGGDTYLDNQQHLGGCLAAEGVGSPKGSGYQESWKQQSPEAKYSQGLETKRRVARLGVVRRPALRVT